MDKEFEILAGLAHESGCDKKQIIAGTWQSNGAFVHATNYCVYEGDLCPRMEMPSGEGYELCEAKHAEANLAKIIEDDDIILGTQIVWVYGHYWACEPCATALKKVGIKEIRVREDI